MKKILSLIFLLLIISTPVLADVQIGEFVITDETTPEEIISYIFQLLVGIGALIAVAMVVMAGVEWMTSEGNPGKIDGAKTKIKNALLGVGVLLGSYLIINTINPQITDVEIDDLQCDSGIIVSVKFEDTGPEVQRCIDSNTAKIEYDIIETINSDSWNFQPGSILKAYAFSEENYKGDVTSFDFSDGSSYGGEIPGNTKSIYFLKRYQGIYLYDDTEYKIKDNLPFYTSTSVPDLTSVGFDNITSSIDFLNAPGAYYSAVLFTGPQYTGRCAYVGTSHTKLSSESLEWNYTDNLGNDSVSSIIINKTTSNSSVPRGEVIFYTTYNCSSGNLIDPTKQVKECRVDINEFPTHNSFASQCGGEGGFKEGDYVMSFQISGNGGVVISTSSIRDGTHYIAGDENTKCQYFAKKGECITILNTSVNSIVGSNKPRGFMIIPTN